MGTVVKGPVMHKGSALLKQLLIPPNMFCKVFCSCLAMHVFRIWLLVFCLKMSHTNPQLKPLLHHHNRWWTINTTQVSQGGEWTSCCKRLMLPLLPLSLIPPSILTSKEYTRWSLLSAVLPNPLFLFQELTAGSVCSLWGMLKTSVIVLFSGLWEVYCSCPPHLQTPVKWMTIFQANYNFLLSCSMRHIPKKAA